MDAQVNSQPIFPRKPGRPAGSKTQIRWNDETRVRVRRAIDQLRSEGMDRPTIRMVFYLLGWKGSDRKRNDYIYSHLCVKLGEWRDEGLISYGLLSDDAGSQARPHTRSEIDEQVRIWKASPTAKRPKDGVLRILVAEQLSLADQFFQWTDRRGFIVSSGGHMRRENLYSFMEDVMNVVVPELKVKEVEVYGLFDYDKAGDDIYGSHARWFLRRYGIQMQQLGITEDQVVAAGFDPEVDHQLEGIIATDPDGWRRRIRELLLGGDGL